MRAREGFTADLRERLRYCLYECHVRQPSRRAAARWVGLAPSTLMRFLAGSTRLDTRSLDRIVDYVRREEHARRKAAA